MFTLIFDHDVGYHASDHALAGGLTMVTGVLGAAAMNDFRRILSFHIISQIGYMVLGLALFTPLGLVGAVFYLVHHIIVKANLFFVAGVAKRIAGSTDLARIGRALRPCAAAGLPVPDPGLLAGRLPAAVGLLGEIRRGEGRAGS